MPDARGGPGTPWTPPPGSAPVSVSRRLKIHYIYGKSDRCHDMSPLYGGCPLLGESVTDGRFHCNLKGMHNVM